MKRGCHRIGRTMTNAKKIWTTLTTLGAMCDDCLVLYEKRSSLLDAVVELKFPRNGQHPEQMYSFCKDIVFAEQL